MMDLAMDVKHLVSNVLLLDDDFLQTKLILVGWSLGSMICM